MSEIGQSDFSESLRIPENITLPVHRTAFNVPIHVLRDEHPNTGFSVCVQASDLATRFSLSRNFLARYLNRRVHHNFSVIYTVLLSSPNFKNPNRLVVAWESSPANGIAKSPVAPATLRLARK